MDTDLTFITNEKDKNLLERFKVLIKGTRFFDVLVGYFYTSGFYALCKPLEDTEKIRILIGIGTNRQAFDLIQKARNLEQNSFQLSPAEVKEGLSNAVTDEMELSEDSSKVEEGIRKFIEWLLNSKSDSPEKNPKMEIRAYPSGNIHSKLYIMTFKEGDRDEGRLITGSSNFTQAGLVDNLEFNVELKNRAGYEFALSSFNELWGNSIDVSEKYIETIRKRTWLNEDITPYELYLKFLYEYFRDDLRQALELSYDYLPENFLKLEYQEQAVLNARRIVEEYGGVFIGKPLGKYVNDKFYYGIKTGFNDAFVIDRNTRDWLIREDPKSSELIKPWLRGKDIHRWYADYQDLYVINILSSANTKWPWSDKKNNDAENVFKKEYPAVFNHLKPYKTKLLNRDDQGQYYWGLRSCAYHKEFERPKIVYADIAKLMRASYDTDGMFCANTMYIMPTDTLFLLGFLNSSLFDWYARNTFQCLGDPWKGGRLRYIAQYMQNVPIPTATEKQQVEIETRVDKILALKKDNPEADVSTLEAEIDQMIYQLYGLTDKEIAIVERRN